MTIDTLENVNDTKRGAALNSNYTVQELQILAGIAK